MTEDDELRINTLHRFQKRSPNLVLHEYSHCEVPAGCGGVVLRWIDPAQGSPARFQLAAVRASCKMWLDGAELASSQGLLRAGRHVIALHLTRERPAPEPFALAIAYETLDDVDDDVVDEDPEDLGTAARWRCTGEPPGDGWLAPGFDDAAWQPVPEATPALLEAQEAYIRSGFEYRAGRGQRVFALEADQLWVRVTFTAPERRR